MSRNQRPTEEIMTTASSTLRDLARLLQRFGCDRRGAVAIIFALCLIPLCLAGGAAIDLGRAYLVKSRLGYALDAAGLAVGAATTNDEDELAVIMQSFFDANYPAAELGVPVVPTLVLTDLGELTCGPAREIILSVYSSPSMNRRPIAMTSW